MKIVHINNSPPYQAVPSCEPQISGDHEVVMLTVRPQASLPDLAVDPDVYHLGSLRSCLPRGWEPDVVYLDVTGYDLLPLGLEDSPWPTVMMLGDWHFVCTNLWPFVGACDDVLTDRAGLQTFSTLGYSNLTYGPRWLKPVREHSGMPEKRYDVLFIGRLNGTFQRERIPYLWRLARLGNRLNVAILTGIHGEDYYRTLSEARIVFNRSIKGEANERVFEAAVSRALLFVERSNLEIRDFFEDRVHCVYYDDDTLEALLDYYLTHDTEREAIVARALERVRAFAPEMDFTKRFDEIGRSGVRGGQRPFVRRPLHRRLLWYARQALGARSAPRRLQVAMAWLTQARSFAQDSLILSDMMVVSTFLAVSSKSQADRAYWSGSALQLAEEGIYLDPSNPILYLNQGWLLKSLSCLPEARRSFEQAITLLHTTSLRDLELLSSPVLVRDSFFTQARNRLFLTRPLRRETLLQEMQCLILWHALQEYARLVLEMGEAGTAEQALKEAVDIRPDLGPARFALAELSIHMGNPQEAIRQLERGLVSDPLYNLPYWLTYLDLLVNSDDQARAKEVTDELLTVSEAIPLVNEAIGDALRQKASLL